MHEPNAEDCAFVHAGTTLHSPTIVTVGAAVAVPSPWRNDHGAVVKPPRSVVFIVLCLVLILAAPTVRADG